METYPSRARPKAFRDLGHEVRAHELRRFEEVLAGRDPITHPLLSNWVSGSDDRAALLAGSVWGGIRWPKFLGQPKTALISSGFIIVHEFRKLEFVDQGGGHYKDVSQWKIQPAPSVWDASTASEYRVAFFFFAGGGGINPNRLLVRLADVPWQFGPTVAPGFIRLDPYGYSDFGNLGERVVFPDFEVRHEPYSRERSVDSLGPARDADQFRSSRRGGAAA